MKSSERQCQSSMISNFVHTRKMKKQTYTNLYTKIRGKMMFRDLAQYQQYCVNPGFTWICGFVTLHEIMGLSSSLSAISLDYQAFTNNVHEFVHENARI